MNKKKIFGYLFLGLLTVGATGTVTSCKDYDDDISNLQKQIDDLKTTVNSIQTAINNGAILTDVTPTDNGVKLTLNKNGRSTSYTITNGTNGKDGADGTVWRINPTTYMWEYKEDGDTDWKTTTYKAVGQKGDKGDKGDTGAAGADGKIYMPNASTGTFWVYNNETDAKNGTNGTDSKISYTSPNAIYGTWTPDYLTLNNVEGATNQKVVISLKSALKSLVFEPDFYYEGVEAMNLATYMLLAGTQNDVTADGDFGNDAPTWAKGDSVAYAPGLKASYFLNPSNAKVLEDSSKYSFIPLDRDFVTRAAANRKFTVTAVKVANGKVNVTASYSGDALKDLKKDNALTVVALRYTSGDSIVTSDFAAVRANKYNNLTLHFALTNDSTKQTAGSEKGNVSKKNVLYATAQEAIKDTADNKGLKVAWNSNGINLASYIYTAANGTQQLDQNATSESALVKEGWTYTFELVGWKNGNNNTSESAHAAIKGSILRPQMTKAGKQQEYGSAQNQAEIGRHPLVRVTLKDPEGKIVAVGYTLIDIVASKEAPAAITPITVINANDNYTIGCPGDVAFADSLTWHEVEENIIAKLDMSKADFEKYYSLDGGVKDATQYDESGNVLTNKVGVVSQTKTDQHASMTEVLKWVVKETTAYDSLVTGKKSSISTLVRYTANSNAPTAAPKYVYLKFIWTPANKYYSPTSSFNNTSKLNKYWYATNSNQNTGYNEIHGSVETVGTTNNKKNGAETDEANDEFVFNIYNTLDGGKAGAKIAELSDPYKKLQSKLTHKFVFLANKTLHEVVSTDGTKVYYETVKDENLIATLVGDSAVKFSGTKVAEELLNKAGHTDLANTLTAQIGIKATVCNDIDVPVTNGSFFVKFLRPINVDDPGTNSVLDGETNGSDVDLALTFTDWRDHNFTDAKVTKGQDYFAYYKVSEVTADVDNATTDLNNGKLGTTKLLAKAPNAKLTFKAGEKSAAGYVQATKLGKIHYENNGSTTGGFTIRVPLKVTYEYGEIVNGYIDITVKGTTNNAKRR